MKTYEANNARDALAKAIYSKLFDHIVSRINRSIPFKASSYYIGVLDIAGFGMLRYRSIVSEQYLYLLPSRILQGQLLRAVLHQLLQREAAAVLQRAHTEVRAGPVRQGVLERPEDILRGQSGLHRFEDLFDFSGFEYQKPLLPDLIESKTTGIFSLLDEESKLPTHSFTHFTSEVHRAWSGHFRIMLPRTSKLKAHREIRDDEGFVIRHFAGGVCYQTVGWFR